MVGRANGSPAAGGDEAGVDGLFAALFAAGLLVVDRANKIISFAHAAITLASGLLFVTLGAEHWSWWIAAPTAIVAAGLLGIAIEVLALRRFARSPRLVVAVAAGRKSVGWGKGGGVGGRGRSEKKKTSRDEL